MREECSTTPCCMLGYVVQTVAGQANVLGALNIRGEGGALKENGAR